MTTSGDYQRLEPDPDASGPAADGTHATLMHMTAALAANGNMVVRELTANLGTTTSFAHVGTTAADAIMERTRT